MNGFSIDISCQCGQTHRLPLDDAGRYEGPTPCDPTKQFRLQIDANEWRQVVEREQAEVKH